MSTELFKPVVLDVTLRDGGYLNDWAFTSEQIDAAVQIAFRSAADFIEVGYLDDQDGLPSAAACPPHMLERLRQQCPSARLAGMIRPSVHQPVAVLAARHGLLDLLRITVDMRWPEKALTLAAHCREYGFEISLNFTGVTTFRPERLTEVSALTPEWVRVIYLADSRGHLQTADVPLLVAAVRQAWSGDIGYHAHDNLGLAIANTEAALAAGCSWIDASIAGVGLGGRNLSLASALVLARQQRTDLHPDPQALAAPPSAIGLLPAGDEMPLYRLCGQRNLRMEWVMPLVRTYGSEGAMALMHELPVRNWFETHELIPFLGEEEWQRILW
jgi:4-hydroxy 2-oxovalerate aldolase